MKAGFCIGMLCGAGVALALAGCSDGAGGREGASVAKPAREADTAAAWAAKRQAAVGRARPFVYNTDGCDMLYWPSNLPVSVGNFTGRRLKDALGTRISTVAYCPQSAGFGHFTCRRAGEPLTGSLPREGCYNSASEFFRLGTDSLEMASRFCETNGLEVFVSIRMNDQHDLVSKPGALSALYPKFKLEHPECVMGDLNRGPRQDELYRGFAGWSCVNFAEGLVRERMKEFVRELVSNYDVDGIEYDFNRHPAFFRSVATGGVATAEELALMTQLMRDLKAITEEVGRKKGRPIVIAARLPDSVEYDRAIGLDLVTWMREKLIDIWIGGGYFLFNPWEKSARLAHECGVKFYASLDESRIHLATKRLGRREIRGRNSVPFYAARISAALAAGCDGVYVFNLENAHLRRVALLDVAKTPEKLYFAVDRGAGGYLPDQFLKDALGYGSLPPLNPGGNFTGSGGVARGALKTMRGGETMEFEMELGDDFASSRRMAVTALALTSLAGGGELARTAPKLLVNGKGTRCVSNDAGLFTYLVAADALHAGANRFSVTFPSSAPSKTTFSDFAVRVQR